MRVTRRQIWIFPTLVLHMSGCKTWQAAPQSPAVIVAEQHPDEIRVTDPIRGRRVLEQPFLRNDSILGMGEERRCISGLNDCVMVPTTIRFAPNAAMTAETRQLSWPRTILAGAAGGVLSKWMYRLLTQESGRSGFSPGCISC
jgi:hypothetical protein